jgi:hypothetical protein
MRKTPYITYLHCGHLPCYVGFTISDKNRSDELRRLGASDVDLPTNKWGCTTTLTKDNVRNGKSRHFCTTIIVRIDPRRPPSSIGTASIVAHEAVHVFDSICEAMGEEEPSEEFQAYCVQWLVQNFLEIYEEQWKKRKR